MCVDAKFLCVINHIIVIVIPLYSIQPNPDKCNYLNRAYKKYNIPSFQKIRSKRIPMRHKLPKRRQYNLYPRLACCNRNDLTN